MPASGYCSSQWTVDCKRLNCWPAKLFPTAASIKIVFLVLMDLLNVGFLPRRSQILSPPLNLVCWCSAVMPYFKDRNLGSITINIFDTVKKQKPQINPIDRETKGYIYISKCKTNRYIYISAVCQTFLFIESRSPH